MATEETRESLLKAATKVFAEKGFSGSRVDEIARRARVNKAMIYYHFGPKQKLYQAVLLRLFSAVREEMEQIAAGEADAQRRLAALYAGLAAMFEREPALPRIMLREFLAGGRNMEIDAARALYRVFDLVRGTLERGRKEGVFRPAHPLLVHMNMAGTLLLYHITGPFRARMMAAIAPAFEELTPEAVLAYLGEVITRTLATNGVADAHRS